MSMNIINDLCVNGRVSSPDSLICEVMGEPELPITRLSKKSKVFNYLYGNVSFLSENGSVCSGLIE